MRRSIVLMLMGLFVIGAVGLGAEVNVMHGWPGEQAPAFEKIVAAFEAENPGIDVVVEIVGRDRPAILATRLAAGNPPDLTPHPWVGTMRQWADAGQIVDLSGLVDTADINPALVPIGEYKGGLYGLFIFPNVKSLVWYNPKVFTDKGYTIPSTWYQLLALSEQILADGGVPWSIGIESGAASGWPGTDWVEDIVLRTAGASIYDQWVNHEIPWTDPRIKLAFETFGSLFDKGYVFGGPIGALTANFGDAADPVFRDPPQAYMHHQATFIQGFFNDHIKGLVAGEDYNIFPLPTITPMATADGSIPLLVSGDVVTVFNNRPEVIKFAQFLTSETAANIWSSELGELSAYVNANPEDFSNPITSKAQEMLLNASVSRFDGSDLMPGEIGSGAFWSGILDYISGISLDTVLASIEAAAQEAY
ncbi:MAG TPA: ABC transporter substrate-binding protein [Candidatus Heimdallarchaeota archaeon]|nr:ABC transporter substrate-binding protein [Candidatus Heimdallarchaeota archaeon]